MYHAAVPISRQWLGIVFMVGDLKETTPEFELRWWSARQGICG